MLLLITLYGSLLKGNHPDPQKHQGMETSNISMVPQDNSITSAPLSISYWHLQNGLKIRSTHKGKYLTILCLLLSGQVEVNPGPQGRTPKFPCGECGKAVTWTGRSVACDRCDKWYHKECLAMTTVNFNALPNTSWECCNCGLPNTSSLFDSSFSSTGSYPGPPTHTSSPNEPQTIRKRKSLRRLKVQHINFQSIWPRKDELEANLEEHDIDIVIGTETHLTPSIQTSEFLPEKYNAIRRDHSDGYGGLIVIHKQDLIVSELKSGKDCEFLSVKVQCHGKKSVVLAGIYRRPSGDMTNIENISRHIEEMVEKHRRQPIWIAGDLNLPDIDWEGLTISGHQYMKAINQTFLQTLERTDLEQVVDFPTRLAASGKWAYLDLLITNRPGLLHKCLATPGISDHTSIIHAEIDCFAQVERPIRRKVHCWKKANIEDLQAYIMREVIALTESHSDDTEVESLWQQIKRISEEGMERFVPSKMTSKRYSQPWFTKKCKRAIRKKNRAYKKAKRTNDNKDWDRFNELWKEAQKACKEANTNYTSRNINADFEENTKRFYTYIKNKRSDNNGVAPLEENGTIKTSSKDKANQSVTKYGTSKSAPTE